MSMKLFIKGAATAGLLAVFGAASAVAQSCEVTEFRSKPAEIYLKAETEYLQNKNNAEASRLLQQLRAIPDLNCYERNAATQLSAGINIAMGRYEDAVRDLESVLRAGVAPEQRKTLTYNIHQLYLQAENMPKARDSFNQWVQLGGRPSRDDNWRMAILNEKLGDQRTSVTFAEKVLAADGRNAKREVYDFLIYLYDKTGQLGKQAQLLETLLARDPTDRRLWDVIAGNYFKSKDERKAFEVYKAMYHAGLLTQESELMRVVNFYNSFNAPYQAAKILEKEINRGKIQSNLKNLELLVNLYQVAREHEKAIPVIEKAAAAGGGAPMLERLGRSHADLQQWGKAEDALTRAINMGGTKDTGLAWVLIGQSRYEKKDRAGAREAFKKANNRGGRGWLSFMNSEDATARALRVFQARQPVIELTNEKDSCDRFKVLNPDQLPEGCKTVDDRLAEAQTKLAEIEKSL